tara:strand:+ start:1233 stop:1586 length:354 start_codon:yes stop_codon:yes gene_type:complete
MDSTIVETLSLLPSAALYLYRDARIFNSERPTSPSGAFGIVGTLGLSEGIAVCCAWVGNGPLFLFGDAEMTKGVTIIRMPQRQANHSREDAAPIATPGSRRQRRKAEREMQKAQRSR